MLLADCRGRHLLLWYNAVDAESEAGIIKKYRCRRRIFISFRLDQHCHFIYVPLSCLILALLTLLLHGMSRVW